MTWPLVALKRVFEPAAGGSWGDPPGEGEVDARCVRGTDLDFNRLEVNMERAPLRSFSRQDIRGRSLRKGDLVIEKSGGGENQPVGRVGLFDSSELAVPTNFAARLRPAPSHDHRFLSYVMASLYFADLTRAAINQTTGIQNLDIRHLLSNAVPIPPLAEQRAIADYLDVETARIDALIAKKQRLIHLLEERRYNFVSAAVTTGLGTERLVETGNRLIPKIPATWRLMRMRHLTTQIVDTPHKTAPVIDDDRFLVVRTSNVKSGRLVYSDARYTDRASWIEWNRRGEPQPGDVLFTREAPAGEACIVPSNQALCIGQRMVLLKVDKRRVTGDWIVHSIYSGSAQRFIEVFSNSTTVAHLNMSDIPDIPVVVPPVHEQQRILDAVRAFDTTSRKSAGLLTRQISLLAERRQALITAALTGEFAVAGAP